MTQQKTLLTADEFYEFCCRNDGRYELVDGEMVVLAPANEQHGNVAFNITGSFYIYSRQSGTGSGGVETGYRVRQDPDTVRGPDVSFNVRSRAEGEEALPRFVPGAPDIAVEVVSPSNTAAQIERKTAEYLAAGSPAGFGWFIRPRPGILAEWRCAAPTAPPSPTLATTSLPTKNCCPAFSLPLSDIFN